MARPLKRPRKLPPRNSGSKPPKTLADLGRNWQTKVARKAMVCRRKDDVRFAFEGVSYRAWQELRKAHPEIDEVILATWQSRVEPAFEQMVTAAHAGDVDAQERLFKHLDGVEQREAAIASRHGSNVTVNVGVQVVGADQIESRRQQMAEWIEKHGGLARKPDDRSQQLIEHDDYLPDRGPMVPGSSFLHVGTPADD